MYTCSYAAVDGVDTRLRGVVNGCSSMHDYDRQLRGWNCIASSLNVVVDG
jgi:hypothetical protein